MLSQKFVRFTQRWPILGVWLLEPDSANNVAFTEFLLIPGGWMHDCFYNDPDLLATFRRSNLQHPAHGRVISSPPNSTSRFSPRLGTHARDAGRRRTASRRKIGDYGRFRLLSISCAEPVFSIWLWRKGDSTQYSQ